MIKSQPHRSFPLFFVAGLLLVLLGGCHEYHFTMRINPNGSADIILESVFTRQQIELQVEQIETFLKKSGQLDTVGNDKTRDPNPSEKETPEDRKLKEKLIAFSKVMNPGTQKEIDDVRFTGDMVHIQSIQRFSSLKELFSDKELTEQFAFEGIRLTPEAGNQATLIVYRDPQIPSPTATYLKRVLSKKVKLYISFQMPGPVSESSLPLLKDNTTGIQVEDDNKEAVDALLTNIQNPITIKFDRGDLALDATMDSKSLREKKAAEQRIGAHLPLTEASRNYYAEALAVSTTQNIQFDTARKFLNNARGRLFNEPNELVVHLRFYTPEGYDFVSMDKLVIVNAVDDQNLPFAIPDNPEQAVQTDFNPNNANRVNDQIDATLHLPLPEKPVKTIRKLELETEVVICNQWKHYRKNIAEIKQGAEFDLNGFVPEGRLTIKKVNINSHESGEIELVVHSGSNPRELSFRCEVNNHSISIFTNEIEQTDRNSQTRHLVLHYNYYIPSNNKQSKLPDLVISRPDGMKRQKARMTIRDVDCY